MKADTESYSRMMYEIKNRSMIVGKILRREIDLIYNPPTVEIIALQIRLMIESIALASLSANKTLFQKKVINSNDSGKQIGYLKILKRKIPNFILNL